MSKTNGDPMIGPDRIGRLLGVAPKTVRALIDRGELLGHRQAWGKRFRRARLSDVVAYARRAGIPLPAGIGAGPVPRVMVLRPGDRPCACDLEQLLAEGWHCIVLADHPTAFDHPRVTVLHADAGPLAVARAVYEACQKGV